MSAIILLEGCDKTGKSTEAERLREILGPDAVVVHFGVPDGNPFEDYRAALIEADQRDGTTIIDRLHWSNWAYQSVYRDGGGAARMELEQVQELDDVMLAIGAMVLLKTRPIEDIAAAMDDEDYGEADVKKVQQLQQLFLARFAEAPRSLPKELIPFPSVAGKLALERAEACRAQALRERGR